MKSDSAYMLACLCNLVNKQVKIIHVPGNATIKQWQTVEHNHAVALSGKHN